MFTFELCISDDYGVNADETWMNRNWFYMTKYDTFGNGGKATKRSLPNNLTQWILTQFKGFARKGIGKISRTVSA